MLDLVILVFASLANLFVGLFVLLKNTANVLNRLFFLLVLSLIGWTTANYFSVTLDVYSQVFLAVELILLFVVIQNTLFFSFANNFPDSSARVFSRRLRIYYLLFSLVTILLAALRLYFMDFDIEDNQIVPIASPVMSIFVGHALLSITGGIWIITQKLLKAKNVQRTQLKLLLIGSTLLFIFVPILNFMLPVFFNNTFFVSFSPIYILFFALIMAYSIIRHRLFDIKAVAARSLAYVLILATLAGTYALIAYGLSLTFFQDTEFVFSQQLSTAMIVVLLAFIFQPLKRTFDHLSNRVFFRDSYDTQVLLDNLGTILATEIDLTKIINKFTQLVLDNLKPSHIRVVVFKDGEVFHDHKVNKPPKSEIDRDFLSKMKDVLIIKDSVIDEEIREKLDEYDAEILLKLHTNEETVGAILLGPKQSGTIYPKQDLDLLAITEQELAIAVQNSRYFEQIQEFNIKLTKEIAAATNQLRKSNEKLKALDEAKDEFISMASHQLRTPLTSVKGYMSMIIEGDAGKIKPEQKRLLEEAFASSQRMVYLIADLLNVSRLRTGKFLIEPTEIDLAKIVDEEVQQIKPIVLSRKLSINYQKPSDFPKVWLDETKIRQVIMNFIDNAIYYTHAGGTIDIQLISKRDYIEYTVKDNGIGVPKADQPKLFTKFFRAGNARKARPDGTGLGLYMAQRIISAQGGSIIFKSAQGKGSSFGFKFPLKSVNSKSAVQVHSEAIKPEVESDEE